MLSKNKIKFLQSLHQKKYRDQEKIFIVEGEKIVSELDSTQVQIYCIVATSEWITRNKHIYNNTEVIEATDEELRKLSTLQNPQKVIAYLSFFTLQNNAKSDGLILALDNIQDPGNMGTIIRLADWFGISQLICSPNTVDIYNPKVIQASMGAIFRVPIQYCDLYQYIQLNPELPAYAADLKGENIYNSTLPKQAIIVMGNEGNGISERLQEIITNNIHIPTFNDSGKTSESLNVAIATAIICSEFKRRL